MDRWVEKSTAQRSLQGGGDGFGGLGGCWREGGGAKERDPSPEGEHLGLLLVILTGRRDVVWWLVWSFIG